MKVCSFFPSIRAYFLLVVFAAGLFGLLRGPAEASPSAYTVTQVTAPPATRESLAPRQAGESNEPVAISQRGRLFVPAEVTIRVHRRIVITNDDDTAHHAYCSAKDFKYNSGAQAVGSVHPIVFPTLGTFEIRCAIHPAMKLVVTVVQ